MSSSIRSLYGGAAGDFVYFERQTNRDRLCGLHCINNLLQGPVVTIETISQIGQELDRAERNLLFSGESDPTYSNISEDGFFSVTVIDQCLATKGFKLTPFNNPSLTDLRNDPAKSRDGFICNLRDHWFAIREVRGRWFSLNSLKPAPETISEFNLASFIGDHVSKNWSVFVIRHLDWPTRKLPITSPQDFPTVTKIVDAVQPLSGGQKAFLSFAAASKLHDIEDAQDQSSLQRETDAVNHRNVQPDRTNRETEPKHTWPTDGGRTVQDGGTAQREDDDPEMRQAMLESALQFQMTLPDPEYPPISEDRTDNIASISIRLTDLTGQTITRRFNPDAKVTDLFRWIHKDPLIMQGQLPLLVIQDEIKLLTAGFPRSTIIRRRTVSRDEWFVVEQDTNISGVTMSKRFPLGENLRMIR